MKNIEIVVVVWVSIIGWVFGIWSKVSKIWLPMPLVSTYTTRQHEYWSDIDSDASAAKFYIDMIFGLTPAKSKMNI